MSPQLLPWAEPADPCAWRDGSDLRCHRRLWAYSWALSHQAHNALMKAMHGNTMLRALPSPRRGLLVLDGLADRAAALVLQRIPRHGKSTSRALRAEWQDDTGRGEFEGCDVAWAATVGPSGRVVGVAKVLVTRELVFLDELASLEDSPDGAARWALSVLLDGGPLSQAIYWLNMETCSLQLCVRVGSDAHGMYTSQWGMAEVAPTADGSVFLRCPLAAVIRSLRSRLVSQDRNATFNSTLCQIA